MGHAHQHFHDRMVELARRDDGVSTAGGTVYSVVYVTAEPTFTGVIGGYTTLSGGGSNSIPAVATATAGGGQAGGKTGASVQFSTAPAETVVASGNANNSFDTAAAAATTAPNSLANASASTTFSPNNVAELTSSGASATAGASQKDGSSSSSGGMATGAKAGIAIGVIAVVGIIAVFLLWILGKKKREREAQANKDNEKSTYGAGAPAATEMINRSPTISSTTAPRLSLRPVSRMLPEFGQPNKARLSGGNLLNTAGEPGAASARNLSPARQPRGPSPTRKPMEREDPFADPENPFADPEKAPSAPAHAAPTSQPAPRMMPMPSAAAAPVAPVAAAAALGGAATAAAFKPKSSPAPVPEPVAARPLPTVQAPAANDESAPQPPVAMASPQPTPRDAPASGPSTPVTPVPIVAAAPAASPASEPPQGNVYRVLLDFTPSMDDELELKNGQLVRLLHEYDDGWALCIRLDRSQQGVVPRTCLATKPSKPKPSHLNQYARPPAHGPGSASRPMSPAGTPRSQNFNSPRPAGMTPPGRPMSPASRPMSPAGGPRRPMSPGPMSPAGSMRPSRSMSPGPGQFNQAPRPLSPGPRPQQKRSMSPGPSRSSPMADVSRRRSNSASVVREKRNSPIGPSKLGPGPSAPGTAL
ncbi:uncharacterized protein PV06_07156 [Exophiala oligosperma]|uniref:SH3 domain-containing protein n=1 Tax=Exophiala oligosperma TaxID=215243 RepID=A0A0D2ANV0_9EURO|nr:uncharacterized protein PV06_07156 [Exophiala oligosperma]KIW41616.1 hypothetical protein PV06_07156 [Exophiala oligosperma]